MKVLIYLLLAVSLWAQKVNYKTQVSNKPEFDPMEFGAKCNGTTDDTVSIQKAIDAISILTGGKLTFPSGKSCKFSHLIYYGSGLWIDGPGQGYVYGGGPRIILTTGAGQSSIEFSGGGFSNTGNRVTNLQFDGTNANNSMDYVVKFAGQQLSHMSNVSIYNGRNGVLYDTCYYCFINEVDMLGLKPLSGIGIGITGRGQLFGERIFINGTNSPFGYQNEPATALKILQSDGIRLSHFSLEHSGTCISITPGENQTVEYSRFIDGFCDQNAVEGPVLLPQHSTAKIHGIRFDQFWSASSGASGFRAGSGIGTVDGLAITNSDFFNNHGNGIDINSGTNIKISGSKFTRNTYQKSGTVNTSSSGYTATLVSGDSFSSTDPGKTVTINGVGYLITAINGGGDIATLATNPGDQSGVAYTLGASNGCGIHVGDVNYVDLIDNRSGVTDSLFNSGNLNTQAYGICGNPGTSADYVNMFFNNVRNNITGGIGFSSSGTHNMIELNPGHNPIGSTVVTPSGSPYTYTAGATRTVLYLNGGTISSVSRDGTNVCSVTPCTIILAAGKSAIITYTVAPTILVDIQ